MTSLAAMPQHVVRAVNRLPPLAVDAVVVVVSECALMWGVTQSNAMNIGDGYGPWPWWMWPLAALLPIPLLWRRRAPFLVLCLSGLGLVALSIPYNLAVTYNHSSEVMLYIAMVTVAYYSDGFKFWFAALVCVGMNLVVEDQGLGKAVISALVTATMFVAGRLAAQQRDLAGLMAARAAEAEQTVEARAAQAAAEERTRIARDMHDILAHAVSLMIVQAEAGAAVVHQDAKKAERPSTRSPMAAGTRWPSCARCSAYSATATGSRWPRSRPWPSCRGWWRRCARRRSTCGWWCTAPRRRFPRTPRWRSTGPCRRPSPTCSSTPGRSGPSCGWTGRRRR
jgi:hypothetical protein